ncbi:MAG: four helix bundle protein [Candidatus Saccharimonadales bacterium]
MTLHYDLPVYKDTFSLIQLIYAFTQDFPRDYKYTLGQDMKHDCMQLMRSIYRANRLKADRVRYLDEFLDNFELLKLEVRLAAELKLLPRSKQARLVALMESIGKQIMGWQKASAK